MNAPEAYIERPVAVLWADELWTLEAFARRVHPNNPLPIPAELSTVIRLMATPCRPVAGDSAPFSPPALRTVQAGEPTGAVSPGPRGSSPNNRRFN